MRATNVVGSNTPKRRRSHANNTERLLNKSTAHLALRSLAAHVMIAATAQNGGAPVVFFNKQT
jgi:hypothetical protein